MAEQKAKGEEVIVHVPPGSAKHVGISAVLVPMDEVEVQPTWTLGGMRTNTTFLRDVSAPIANVVGELGQGWAVIGRGGRVSIGDSPRRQPTAPIAPRPRPGQHDDRRRRASPAVT